MAASIIPTPFSAFDNAWGPVTNPGQRWTGAQGWLNADALGLGQGFALTDMDKATASAMGNAAKAFQTIQEGITGTASGAKEIAPDGGILGGISHWFVRGAVIITGFIFLAVGLSMFKQTVINVPPT